MTILESIIYGIISSLIVTVFFRIYDKRTQK